MNQKWVSREELAETFPGPSTSRIVVVDEPPLDAIRRLFKTLDDMEALPRDPVIVLSSKGLEALGMTFEAADATLRKMWGARLVIEDQFEAFTLQRGTIPGITIHVEEPPPKIHAPKGRHNEPWRRKNRRSRR